MPSSFWKDLMSSLKPQEKSIPVLFSLLQQLQPVELTEKKVVLGCPNYGLKFVLEKKMFEIEEAVSRFYGKKLDIELTVIQISKKKPAGPLLQFQPTLGDQFTKMGLQAKYSFDNFAVSSTNQVAFAASQAVTANPGRAYNPLFLYGGVGVGKTHLAQAVAKKILEQGENFKALFCPGDQFTNELIESIREHATPAFRRRYRRLQLLILDDAQFIAGKEAVQEEFFHTFNSIVSSGGQVILTADKPPQQIAGLEDRLRSRFSGGLIVDIQPPDFELRCAIVLIKAKEKNIEIDIEAAKLIAQHVSDSRALEGALLTLYTKTLGIKEIIDIETARVFFSEKRNEGVRRITANDVIKNVCSYYKIRPSYLKGNTRVANIILPRQIAMYILREYLKLRFTEVAFLLKRKDHTTVMHATEKISRLITKDPFVKQEIDQLIQSLRLST